MLCIRFAYKLCSRQLTNFILQRGKHIANLDSNRVAIRSVEGWDNLQLTLSYARGTDGGHRVFIFYQRKNRELKKTTDRMRLRIGAFENKYKKISKRTKPPIQVFVEGKPADEDQPNVAVWKEGTRLQIFDTSYYVEMNVPAVTWIKLPEVIVSGFPCYLKLKVEFADLNFCEIVWYRSKTQENVEEKDPKKKKKDVKWEQIHTGQSYLPNNSDIGKKLMVICIPKNANQTGDKRKVISSTTVTAGPGLCPFENRHIHTSTTTPTGQFRMVSYNMLADFYASSNFSRDKMFPYCPPYALLFDYRRLLLLKELTGYNADIICLQECDKNFFQHDLLSVLGTHGITGSFLQKYSFRTEGEAVFYRQDKFKFIEQTEVNVNKTLTTSLLHIDLWLKIQTNRTLTKRVLEPGTCLQTVLLESKEDPNNKVLVANTHLYYHPKANLIRIIQTEVVLKHIEELLKKYETQGPRPTVIFCGDLNSPPTGSVIEYITAGVLGEDCKDFFGEENERIIPKLSLRHNLELTSAIGIPQYTNFTAGFKDTLDYIFIENSRLNTTKEIPMPTDDELTRFVAIPSVVFPSDHIALVCDLEF